MVRCPVCAKVQLVHVVGPARTTCYYCGARWVQGQDEQYAVIGPDAPAPIENETSKTLEVLPKIAGEKVRGEPLM
jgi:hypothetical protein